MLTLYGSGTSRWIRPLWLLRELDVPHEAIEVDRAGGGLEAAEFRALNPTGKIPVLVHEGQALWESGAIVTYLADRFPERGLVPAPGTLARGLHDQWMFFVHTELEPAVWSLHKHVHKGVGGAEVGELARQDVLVAAAVLERHLERREWLCERFAVVDVVLASLLTWRVLRDVVPAFPRLLDYRGRATSRPAFPADRYG